MWWAVALGVFVLAFWVIIPVTIESIAEAQKLKEKEENDEKSV